MKSQVTDYAPQKQTIFLNGPLNAAKMEDVRHLFDLMATSQAQEVVIDLTKVHKLDASGVGALVFLFKRLKRAKRHLVIKGVHGQPEAIIRLLRMEQAIETHFAN